MALPSKKPGLEVMIGVGKKPGGAPRPPDGIPGAPSHPDPMDDEQPDDDATEDADVTARLDRMESLIKKIAEAVGVDESSEGESALPPDDAQVPQQ